MEALEFRAAFSTVPPNERDAWVDRLFGLGELPSDGQLPAGCVPYLPCAVDILMRVVERAPLQSSDAFVDIGSGVGRAAAFVQLLSGATVLGLEIQPALVAASRALAQRLGISRATFLEGDAATLVEEPREGNVFFLYCPFSGERLKRVLASLERRARTREIRICAVDLPLPACDWLVLQDASPDLAIYRSL